jgi:DNA-binding GntR family transcriptional regulator
MKPRNVEKPSSVVEQIYRSLSKAILNQELEPGTPLTEAELQEWYGVSRAPIREAIRLLESEGLVVVNAFKKKYVRKLSHEELQETYTVLGCLEGFAAHLAVPRITDAQLARLGETIEEMKEEYENKNLERCAKLNFEFHRTIIDAARNELLKKSIASIMKGPGWYWLTRTYYRDPGLVLSSIKDHSEILSALRSRDAECVEQKVRAHFANVRSNWKDQMR